MISLKLSLLTWLIAAPGLLVFAENVISCNGNVQRLSCDSGVITTHSVYYGRTTKKVCNVNRTATELSNTTCSSTVTSPVAERCNGLKVCEFKTDSLGLADPCHGTYKYFNTTYSCISARTNVICDDSYSTLTCGNDTVSILRATYGRSDHTTCGHGLATNLTSNTNCSFNARSKVSTLCNGKNRCTLRASSTNFTDVCPGTYKYLTVTYTCAPPHNTVVACEGNNATLTCGNHTIKVYKANYGRSDMTTCSAGFPICQVFNKNCTKTDSLAIVAKSCNGKKNCVVPATSQFFGDPCSGTHKYLSVEYSCV